MNLRVVRILSDFSNMCGDEGRAMRWKNKKQKLQYIEKICEDNAQAIKQKLPVLLELSQDKNPEVRGMLAENLVLFDCEETEEILYNMLSDQNRMAAWKQWIRLALEGAGNQSRKLPLC